MLCNVIPAGIQFVKLECWSTFIQFINLRFLGICNAIINVQVGNISMLISGNIRSN